MAGFLAIITILLFVFTITPNIVSVRSQQQSSLPFVETTPNGRCIYFKNVKTKTPSDPRGNPVYGGLFNRFFAGEGPEFNIFKPGDKLTEFTTTFIFSSALEKSTRSISLSGWVIGITISEADNINILIPLDIIIHNSVPLGDYKYLNQSLPHDVGQLFSNVTLGKYVFSNSGLNKGSRCTARLPQFRKNAKKINPYCWPKAYQPGSYRLPGSTKLNYKATNVTGVSYLMVATGFDVPDLRIAARICFKGSF